VEFDNKTKIYGITQIYDTKDYLIVIENEYCKNCNEKYTNIDDEWCKPCLINYLKQDFTNWTSGNVKIDKLIQAMQLKINDSDEIIFEWIPYNQFSNIKKIDEGGFSTIYLGIWKNGPLMNNQFNNFIRDQNKKIILKCLHNSQNSIIKFLKEV
jgi:hypothetical protein